MGNKVSQENIATMSSEELDGRLCSLVSYIERENKRGKKHLELETEACYFYRELEWRKTVRANHVTYLQNKLLNSEEVLYNDYEG